MMCCPRDMRPGDIYTHTYHGYTSSIIDASTGTIHPEVVDAKRRGVLFDVGHGQGAFNWTVTEICAKKKFWPDIIGSDLHTGNQNGPAYDLPMVMSKFFHLGMSITDLIKAATATPAQAINQSHVIGSLTVGQQADITVLKIIDTDIDLEDCQSQTRRVKKLIRPVAVWKGGRPFDITKPAFFPNTDARARNASAWNTIIIRDSTPPVELKTK